MSRISWQKTEPQVEDGVDRGIIFPPAGMATPWYGLVRVDEVEKASESESYFIDGVAAGESSPVEDFSAVVEAFTYPDILDEAFVFGFSYRSNVGLDGHYRIHLVYNATFDTPGENQVTISDRIDPKNFIFSLETTHERVRKTRPFSHIYLDSSELHPLQLQDIEDRLYGTDETDPEMPTPIWIMELLGTWTYGFGHGPFGHLPFGGHTS